MAWNEPGGDGKRRDPWQGGGGDPPDLERLLQRWKERLSRFGGGGRGLGPVELVLIALLLGWLAYDSCTKVDESQRGVVLRFGKFERVMGSGLNFNWPRPIETVTVVDTTRVRSTSDHLKMLTKDENIVDVDFNVQYSVTDPYKFLFGVREPEETLKQAADSAVRQVIGNAEMDTILSGERTNLATHSREILRETMERYGTGIAVSELNFQNLRPPADVKEAFDDVVIAREDKQRIENEANAYASKIVPEARGQAARVRAEAEGAKASMVAQAEGEAQRFALVAAQYKAAPQVTRKRLYLETMQQVLQSTSKILTDGGSNRILMMPVERGGQGVVTLPDYSTAPAAAAVAAPEPAPAARSARPERRARGEDKQ